MTSHEKNAEGFYRLTTLDTLAEVDEGGILSIPVQEDNDQVEVGLVQVEGQIYAFRDICPHMAFPLSVGRVRGKILECAGHGWEFDVTTGKTIYPPVRKNMIRYELRLEEGYIWVKIDPFF